MIKTQNEHQNFIDYCTKYKVCPNCGEALQYIYITKSYGIYIPFISERKTKLTEGYKCNSCKWNNLEIDDNYIGSIY